MLLKDWRDKLGEIGWSDWKLADHDNVNEDQPGIQHQQLFRISGRAYNYIIVGHESRMTLNYPRY